jgi:hypothetical protein
MARAREGHRPASTGIILKEAGATLTPCCCRCASVFLMLAANRPKTEPDLPSMCSWWRVAKLTRRPYTQPTYMKERT